MIHLIKPNYSSQILLPLGAMFGTAYTLTTPTGYFIRFINSVITGLLLGILIDNCTE